MAQVAFYTTAGTDNNGLVFKCILHSIIVRYITIPKIVEFPDFPPSGFSVHFVPYRKDKIRTVRKKS
jgi:hypothetical protein